MALNDPPALLPMIAATAVFVVVGGCELSPLTPSFAASRQQFVRP